MNNDKAKELLKEIFGAKEEKHSYPEEYPNIVRCMADYRYIKKKSRRFFNSFNGSRNYVNCSFSNGSIIPSIIKSTINDNGTRYVIDERTYCAVLYLRDRSSVMTEFEFLRPILLNKEGTKMKVADHFESCSRTMYGSNDYSTSIPGEEDGCLTCQDVAWALTDLIHTACDLNLEDDRKGDRWRNGIEVILQTHMLRNDIVGHWYKYDGDTKKIHSQIDVYNIPITGFTNSTNSVEYNFPRQILQQ